MGLHPVGLALWINVIADARRAIDIHQFSLLTTNMLIAFRCKVLQPPGRIRVAHLMGCLFACNAMLRPCQIGAKEH